MGILRIICLKGEYINKIQKTNNSFRNTLCDYDLECVDIEDLMKGCMNGYIEEMVKNVLEILKICLNFKLKLFNNLNNKTIKNIYTLSLKNDFDNLNTLLL
jgi:hypothetical protein